MRLYKYLFVVSFCLISMFSYGASTLASKEQIASFKNTKTCVVMDDGASFFNMPVREAVQKYWKTTAYEIIDRKEFEKRKTDTKYSFIILMEGSYDKDPGGVSYSYISLVLGDPSGSLMKLPEFCSIPLSYAGDNDADYEYIIPMVIKFMQIHVKNLEKDRFPISLNGLRYYNKTGYKEKELLLNKDKMAPNADSREKISSVYPYSFKLMSTEEIQEQINGENSNKIFHFHVGPPQDGGAGKCFEMVFDADGNLYYFNSRKITNDNPDGFNLKDFNQIK
jgi:hypothetical protein